MLTSRTNVPSLGDGALALVLFHLPMNNPVSTDDATKRARFVAVRTKALAMISMQNEQWWSKAEIEIGSGRGGRERAE